MENKKVCSVCGNSFDTLKGGMCSSCYRKDYYKKYDIPCKLRAAERKYRKQEQLVKALDTLNYYNDIINDLKTSSYEKVAQKHGVSKQAINKIIMRLIKSYDERNKE